MSAILNERVSSAPSTMPGVTRVAIREVREAAFRAFVATGASNAEAKVASEQVLFTELHRGSGLVALLQELAAGPWLGRDWPAHGTTPGNSRSSGSPDRADPVHFGKAPSWSTC